MTTTPFKNDPRGQSHIIDVEARGMHPMQLVREFVQNGAEADATSIVIDVFTDPISERRLLRFSDNGHGMTHAQMKQHLTTLYSTSRTLGDNFGIGARVASLPSNPAGVDFASRTPSPTEGEALMRLHRSRAGIYGVHNWVVVDSEGYDTTTDLVTPGGELERVKGSSGTAVVLHGNGTEDTYTGSRAWSIYTYLSNHYLALPGDPTLGVRVPNESNPSKDSLRRILPLGEKLGAVAEHSGVVPFRDVAGLSGRFHWWVLPDRTDQRKAGTAVPAPAGIAMVCANELFGLATIYSAEFGMVYRKVQDRVLVIIDVDGAEMDAGRSTLILPGHAKSIPWKRLGAHFSEHLPAEIQVLVDAVTFTSNSIDEDIARLLDPEWMRKLKPRRVLAPAADADDDTSGGGDGEALPDAPGDVEREDSTSTAREAKPTSRDRAVSGDRPAKERNVVSLPKVVFVDPAVEGAGVDYGWIVYIENSNIVKVWEDCPPYVREIDRWVTETGKPFGLVEAAVQTAYSLELAAAIIDANGQGRHGVDPATIEKMKEPSALLMKLLGVQAIERTIEVTLRELGRIS